MEQAITLDLILQIMAYIVGIGGGVTIIIKAIQSVNARHDKEVQWDKNTEDIKDIYKKLEDAHTYATQELAEVERKMNEKLEESHSDTEAKLQEIKAEQCMQTYVLQAVLDGLHQLNCNGEVTKASEKLSKYINEQAHGVLNDD